MHLTSLCHSTRTLHGFLFSHAFRGPFLATNVPAPQVTSTPTIALDSIRIGACQLYELHEVYLNPAHLTISFTISPYLNGWLLHFLLQLQFHGSQDISPYSYSLCLFCATNITWNPGRTTNVSPLSHHCRFISSLILRSANQLWPLRATSQ